MTANFWPWSELELDETGDVRTIKRAYAKRLRQIDHESDPQAFGILRDAYSYALDLAGGDFSRHARLREVIVDDDGEDAERLVLEIIETGTGTKTAPSRDEKDADTVADVVQIELPSTEDDKPERTTRIDLTDPETNETESGLNGGSADPIKIELEDRWGDAEPEPETKDSDNEVAHIELPDVDQPPADETRDRGEKDDREDHVGEEDDDGNRDDDDDDDDDYDEDFGYHQDGEIAAAWGGIERALEVKSFNPHVEQTKWIRALEPLDDLSIAQFQQVERMVFHHLSGEIEYLDDGSVSISGKLSKPAAKALNKRFSWLSDLPGLEKRFGGSAHEMQQVLIQILHPEQVKKDQYADAGGPETYQVGGNANGPTRKSPWFFTWWGILLIILIIRAIAAAG